MPSPQTPDTQEKTTEDQSEPARTTEDKDIPPEFENVYRRVEGYSNSQNGEQEAAENHSDN